MTREEINIVVHDSCILFCKHCGCGIPRDTCTSLGTCKGHDKYRDAIRAYFKAMEEEMYKQMEEDYYKSLADKEDNYGKNRC